MRARRSRQQWEKIIGTFQRSGLTLERFCAPRGIRPDTLKWWQWQLRRSNKEKALPAVTSREAVRWVAVDVVAPAGSATARPAVAILIAGVELRVEPGVDVGYVSDLVAALRARC